VKHPREFAYVYIYIGKVDFRKWIDGLASIVKLEMQKEFLEPHLFVFISKCRSKMKALYWDQTGFAVWYKRLEKGKFPYPKSEEKCFEISSKEFSLLLDGYDITKIKPHEKIKILAVC